MDQFAQTIVELGATYYIIVAISVWIFAGVIFGISSTNWSDYVLSMIGMIALAVFWPVLIILLIMVGFITGIWAATSRWRKA